jgi:hypothetical protein
LGAGISARHRSRSRGARKCADRPLVVARGDAQGELARLARAEPPGERFDRGGGLDVAEGRALQPAPRRPGADRGFVDARRIEAQAAPERVEGRQRELGDA